MEKLLIKVDTKENGAFLKELLQKLNFVVEVELESDLPKKIEDEITNVGGLLQRFGNKEMIEDKKPSAVDFVNKWAGFLKEDDMEKAKLNYLLEKYK